MLRRTLLVIVALFTAVAFTACDTVTDLGEVPLRGTWDAQGALQTMVSPSTLRVSFDSDNPDGTSSGTWRYGGLIGPVTDGTNQDGQIEFTMQNFQGQTVVFNGELRDRFVMEGTLIGFDLDGPAVFRVTST